MPATILTMSPELERLIDERLDAVDRILSLSRTVRSERTQILSDLESQIRDRLATKTSGEPTRTNLLAVFAEIDPPEAYLDEDVSSSPPFRASGFANEGNHRVTSDALAISTPATQSEKGHLARWAGILVSTGCILTPFSILVFSNSEVLASLALALQLTILLGGFLALLNLLQNGLKSNINRLISWACVGATPWALYLFVIWTGMILNVWGNAGELAAIITHFFIPGCLMTHGIWLGFFTLRYLREPRNA